MTPSLPELKLKCWVRLSTGWWGHNYLLQLGENVSPQLNFAKYKTERIKVFPNKTVMDFFEVKLSELFIFTLMWRNWLGEVMLYLVVIKIR